MPLKNSGLFFTLCAAVGARHSVYQPLLSAQIKLVVAHSTVVLINTGWMRQRPLACALPAKEGRLV